MAFPTPIPVTFPLASTVATKELLVLHKPPAVVFDKAIFDPTSTVVTPAMAGTIGNVFTVTTLVTAVEQLLLLVTV